jgi:hypothetical protein
LKTDRYYIERSIAPGIGIIVFIWCLNYPSIFRISDPEAIISKVVDISFIFFGFLLTVLALILQSTAEVKSTLLFDNLIRYNKRVVIVATLLGFYSLLYVAKYNEMTLSCFGSYSWPIFLFLLTWMALDSLYFIYIFYRLAQLKKV